MRRIFLSSILLVLNFGLSAQERLRISKQEAETIFLQNNLLLISEKLNIESQQAEVIQAKSWANPEFSISEINLWKNSTVEPSPPFFGNLGRNQQIAFEISQLVQTAGKRKKLIALEEVDVSKAEKYFEDLLRGLKLELRNKLIDLQYIQHSIKVHQKLIESISILTNAYQNQLSAGNISKAEYIRLKAQHLEINKEILELNHQSNEVQKELRLLLRLSPTFSIEITDDDFMKSAKSYEMLFADQTIESAKENRPDYKLALLEEDYSQKRLAYEKAQRTPDLKFGVNYDRNGSTMLNFVGVGVSFDLPFFNRNKGNIQKAQISIENAKIQREQADLTIRNEIYLSYQLLQQATDFLNTIEIDYETDLDLLLESYTKNFTARNVSMLEYFDFMDAYLSNKKIILEAQKNVAQKTEELNYSLGKDL
ncbi:MAG: TolC family protein [Cruoricaptor ignavus]|nr:TolC family protein [Cruoricaptor ignavus]